MKYLKIHITYIIILILSVGMSIFSVVAIKGHRDKIQSEYHQQTEARTQCQTWADKLDDEMASNTIEEKFNESSEMTIPEKDPWGQPIRILHNRTGLRNIFKVISAGPDQKAGTNDDIIETRHAACMPESQ